MVSKNNISDMADDRCKRQRTSMPVSIPLALPTMCAILQNVVVQNGASSTEGPVPPAPGAPGQLQLAYGGDHQPSTSCESTHLASSLPVISIPDDAFDITDVETAILLKEIEDEASNFTLGTNAPISDNTHHTKIGAVIPNDINIGDVDLQDMCLEFSVPNVLTPLDGYDSADDFESLLKGKSTVASSSKGKVTKVKASQRGAGSFGKGIRLPSTKCPEVEATPSASGLSKKKQAKAPTNTGASILKTMLAAPLPLPGTSNSRKDELKNKKCGGRKQVKDRVASSVKPDRRTALKSVSSNVVRSTPVVKAAPVLNRDSDSESEMFSQACDRDVFTSFFKLKDRLKREHKEFSKKLADAEKAEQRTAEDLRVAQERHKVARETLLRSRSAYDKSLKKIRKLEESLK